MIDELALLLRELDQGGGEGRGATKENDSPADSEGGSFASESRAVGPSDKVLFDHKVYWVMNIKEDPGLRDTFATLGVADERRQSLIPSLQVPVSSLHLLSCESIHDLLIGTWPHQQVHQQQVQSASKQR